MRVGYKKSLLKSVCIFLAGALPYISPMPGVAFPPTPVEHEESITIATTNIMAYHYRYGNPAFRIFRERTGTWFTP